MLRQCTSDQYEALLEVSRAIASRHDFPSLLESLTVLLHSVARFDYLSLMLYSPEDDDFCVFYPNEPKKPILTSGGFGFLDGPSGWVWVNQQPLTCDIGEIDRGFPKVAARRQEQGIVSCCAIPLTTSLRKLGTIEFLSTRPNVYRTEDIYFMQQVASQVAVAVDNALHYDSSRAYQEELETLVGVSLAMVSSLNLQELLEAISCRIEKSLEAKFNISLVLHDADANVLRWSAVHNPYGAKSIGLGRSIPLSGSVAYSPVAMAFNSAEIICLTKQQLEELSVKNKYVSLVMGDGIQSICSIPLKVTNRVIGVLTIGHLGKESFDKCEIRRLSAIASQISVSVDNSRAYTEISYLKDKLATEKLYLEEEIRTIYNFEEMIGESDALKTVLEQIETVALSDATVMILGETGTGKELVARAIHRLSPRNSHTLMKLNCAAIPSGLLESDLFGHEKGAFTGAIAQKLGRFELANRGTLFLDEIGDMPLELQPKLLRAIQEGEIERLGGTRSFQVDVRLIAATHRNLDEMIIAGQFRRDLFYRLNVFPIVLPPLRERPEDIPLLTRHFVQKYSQIMRKQIESVPSATMRALKAMPWDGNIRELENLIERAVIISKGPVLNVPLPELPGGHTSFCAMPCSTAELLRDTTFEEDSEERDAITRALQESNGCIAGPHGAAAKVGLKRSAFLTKMRRLKISVHPEGGGGKERENIMRALRDSHGIIAGPHGAAARLGLKRTTLYSRMQQLGISYSRMQ